MFSSLPRLFHFFAAASFLAANIYAQQPELRQPLITRAVDERELVRLKGNTHPLAKPQFDMGAAPADMRLDRMLLVLKRSPEQDFTLHKLLDDQQDKASPNYHKWLAPEEFGKRFGPSDQDIHQVTGWLQTHGFEVNRVSKGRSVIEFSGVESQVEEAFHTPIHRYLANNEEHWANAADPQIPAALAPAVAGVWSLHDFRKQPKIKISNERIPIPANGASPLLTNQGRHALMPGDFATIYNLSPLYAANVNGQGATIAVVARSNINTGDIWSFRNLAGLPSTPLNIVYDGTDPGIFDPNEQFEADLDASWSGAVAPNATVNFVLSASTNTTDGVDLSELYIVDNNAGDVMTESFGSCEGFASSAEAQALSALAEQAAAEGITYMVSSGDSGAEGCISPSSPGAGNATPSVNVLASPAYLVSVGGTIFNENSNNSAYWNTTNNQTNLSSAKSYIPEDVWNESCPGTCGLWSGGGGVSTFFSKPNWQFGVAGIPNDGHRDQPDVSLAAAGGHDPYLLCFEGSCSQGGLYGVGGTSASAPSFAGIMALVVQQYGRQGLANYVLYRLAAAETLAQCNGSNTAGLPNAACIFNDVTIGNNAVPGELNYGTPSAVYQAGTGYDLATGLGSVNAYNLVTKWNTVTFNATTTTLGPSTISGTHGTPVSLNISVAPSSGKGVPSGDVSLQTGLNNMAKPGFVTLDNTGAAAAQVSNLPGGNYTLTARYGGDATYAPSTSGGVQVNITPENSATTVSLFTLDALGNLVPFSGGTYGTLVYTRADVTGTSGVGIPSGAVKFQLLQPGINTFFDTSLNSQGNTSLPLSWGTYPAGKTSIYALYYGDSSFNSSTSPTVSFTITQASTTTSVAASPTSAASGSSVSLQATVSASGFGTFPTGTVNFFAGKAQIGSAQLFGNASTSGVSSAALLNTNNLALGQNSVTAQYGGDNNYTGSSSSAITVSISPDFTLAVGNSTVTVSQGGSVTDTLIMTGQTGYNNTVNFTAASCSGLPYLTTCSFSPPSVTGTGNSTVMIATSAPSFAAVRSIGFKTVVLFAGVLLMGVPSRRVRSYGALSVILCVLVIGTIACGGGSSSSNNNHVSSPGTPKGSYPISVTATTTDQVISHTVSFTLVVQ